MDLLGPTFDFLPFLTSFKLRAVDRSVFRHLSPRPAPPAPQSLLQISAVTSLQAAVQLEVACFIFCILRDKHLSIDRPVSPFFRLASPAAAGFVCYIAAILLVATS